MSRFNELRKQVRRLSVEDPMLAQPTAVESDGSIQVGDTAGKIENHVRTYQENGFGNAIHTAQEVYGQEDLKPALPVGAEMVKEHRQVVRSLLDKGCP